LVSARCTRRRQVGGGASLGRKLGSKPDEKTLRRSFALALLALSAFLVFRIL
jgi:uncharacterized membrane protein YfcA